MEIVWALYLTVCSQNQCLNQVVDTYPTIQECALDKIEHDMLPQDGDWKTVTYSCTKKKEKKI